MAWLNATPKPSIDGKLAQVADKRSRLKRQQDDGFLLASMPPLSSDYLTRVFFVDGPALSSGMGQYPLTQQELESLQRNTGLELNPWEVRTLRRLSAEWLAESHKAESDDCPAPYTDLSEERRRDVAKHIRNLFRN